MDDHKIKALLSFQGYDFTNALNAINAIQQLRQQNIYFDKNDLKQLKQDLDSKIQLKNTVSWPNKTNETVFSKQMPLMCDADNNILKTNIYLKQEHHRTNCIHYIFEANGTSYELYSSQQHPVLIRYAKLAHPDSHIDDEGFSLQLHAFKKEATADQDYILRAATEKDVAFHLDLKKEPTQRLFTLHNEILDLLNNNTDYLYLATANKDESFAFLANLLEHTSSRSDYSKRIAFISDSKGNLMATLDLYCGDYYQSKYEISNTSHNKAVFQKYFDLPWDSNGVQLSNPNSTIGSKENSAIEKQLLLKSQYHFSLAKGNEYDELIIYNSNLKIIDQNPWIAFELTDHKLVEEIEAYCILRELLNDKDKVITDNLARAVAHLIYIQQQKFNVQSNQESKEKAWAKLSNSVNQAMRELLTDLDLSKDNNSVLSITINDLIQYMDDVINKRPVNQRMFALIAADGRNTVSLKNSEYGLQQAINLNLNHKIDYATDEEQQSIISMLSPAVRKSIVKIYRIHQDKILDGHIKTLVHGTSNISVLNILGQGLLDYNTLKRNGARNYRYTGSGLGDGIYFARPDQIEKSLNYTGYSEYSYVFICSVAYHNIYDIKHYDANLNSKNCDLVWGHAVGSYDRDELVAKSPKQVRLEYVIKFKH